MTMTKPDIINLQSWYTMEEDGGTAYDSHGNRHMTQKSGTIPRGKGKIGYCRNFERDATHYLLRDSFGISNGQSIVTGLWIKPESIGATMNILYAPDVFRLRITSTGILEASIYDGAEWQTAQYPTTLIPATWYFVTSKIDRSQFLGNSVFLELQVNNGAVAGAIIIDLLGGDAPMDSSGLYVGANSSNANNFDGKMDELFIFEDYYSSMSADELTWLYNDGVGRSYVDMNSQSFMAMF